MIFFLPIPQPPPSTLFPYTTLFRSMAQGNTVRSAGPGEITLYVRHGGDVGTVATAIAPALLEVDRRLAITFVDRKSTRLNSSHSQSSYAVFCLKKKTDSLKCGTRGT